MVVTFSYRLGSLGWPLSANWGLRDQLAALEWVQREIARVRRRPGARHARRPVGRRGVRRRPARLPRPPRGCSRRRSCTRRRCPRRRSDPSARRALGARPRRRPLDAPAGDVVGAPRGAAARGRAGPGTRGAALADARRAAAARLAARRARTRGSRSRCSSARRATRRRSCSAPAGARRSDEQVRARDARSCSASPTRALGARARGGGRARPPASGIDHASPDPRLGALHTIDVPLLFGTFRQRGRAATTSPTTSATRASSRRWMQRRVGALPARRGPGLARRHPRDRRSPRAPRRLADLHTTFELHTLGRRWRGRSTSSSPAAA